MVGSVKFFNEQKGFGFLIPKDGSQDVFFHITQAVEGFQPTEGDTISYEIAHGRDGRPAAANVVPLSELEEEIEETLKEEDTATESEEVKKYRARLIDSVNEKLVRELAANPSLISSISLKELEILVAKILDDMGYEVAFEPEDETGSSYIIALSKLPNQDIVRTVVSCKKHDQQIAGNVIEQFLWVIEKKNYANKGIIVTNSSFSIEALRYEEEYFRKLSLHDKEDITKWLRDYVQTNNESSLYTPELNLGKGKKAQSKRKELDELIQRDHLERCLNELYQLAEYSGDAELQGMVLVITGGLASIEKEYRKLNQIDFRTYLMERAKIREATVTFIKWVFELPLN